MIVGTIAIFWFGISLLLLVGICIGWEIRRCVADGVGEEGDASHSGDGCRESSFEEFDGLSVDRSGSGPSLAGFSLVSSEGDRGIAATSPDVGAGVKAAARSSGKVIVVIAYRRYGYTRRVLEALAACDGIEEYTVLIHVDPGYTPVEDLVRNFPLPNKQVVINSHRLGCNLNIKTAIEHGFELADFVIVIEDDVVPSRDALRFFEHANLVYREDSKCYGACAYHNRGMPSAADFHKLLRVKWFTPWGWATWKDRWEEMRSNWPGSAPKDVSWDIVANKISRGDRYVVHPWLARAQNIGALDGTYCVDPAFHAANQFNPDWAGAVNVPAGSFHE